MSSRPESPALAPAPESRAPIGPIALVLFASLMDALGFGILLPTLPFFARSLGATPELITLTMAMYTCGLFLGMPLFGRLSDRIGRKPLICAGLVGVIGCYLVLSSASSVWVLIAARLAGGFAAGNAAACTAYLVDVTSEAERAKYMGLSGALFGFGFAAGPVLGSLLSQGPQGIDYVRPILVAAAMTGTALLAILLFLPESRAEMGRGTAEPEVAGLGERFRRLSRVLLLVAVCHALSGLSSGLYETILPLWAADFELVDGPADIWILILPGGIGFIFAQAALIGPLSARFGEARVVLWSAGPLALMTFGVTVAADASSLIAVIVFTAAIGVFAALVIAANHTLASKLAPRASRGEVMGLFAAVGTIARTIGMIISGIAYANLHAHSPYWLAACCSAAILLVAYGLPRRVSDALSLREFFTGEARHDMDEVERPRATAEGA